MADILRLDLAAHPAETTRLAEWVAEVAAAHNLSADITFRLDVCLVEAAANVIAYAFDDPNGRGMVIQVEFRGECLSVTIEDDGRPFDPLQVEPPHIPQRLEDAPIGGLGIHLIRTMADAVGYQRQDGRNRLLLAFHDRSAQSSQ